MENHSNIMEMDRKIEDKEDLYSELLLESSQPFTMGFPDGKIFLNNPAFNKLIGYNADEIKSISWNKELTPEKWHHIEKEILKEINATKRPMRYEKEYIKKDGPIIPVELFTHPYYGLDGELKYYYSFITDISSRKKVEKKLLISEKRYHTLFENAESGIFLMDNDIIVECNQKSRDMFGVTPEDIIGQSPIKFSPEYQDDGEKSEDKALCMIEMALAGKPQHFEWRHMRMDDSLFYAQVSLNRLKIEEDYLLQAIVMDVSIRKKTQNLLKESEKRHRIVGELISDFAYSCVQKETGTYEVDWITGSFYNITGFTPDDLEKNRCWMFSVHPDDIKTAQHQLDEIKIGEKNVKTFRIISRDGEVKWLRNHIECTEDSQIKKLRIYGAAQDITLEKKFLSDLKWELKINQSLSHIYAPLISDSSSMKDVSFTIFEESKKLTRSKLGYVGIIEPETRDMVVFTHTSIMAECDLIDLDEKIKFSPDNDGSYPSLWGHALNTHQGFYTNSPSNHQTSQGIPSGHVKLDNFISVPVLAQDELLGQIALANSKGGYQDKDLETLERLSEFYALAIQRMRFKEDLIASIKDKELLLREIHHRVKNNLQIIVSLLNLQSAETEEKEAKEFCRVSQDRVRSMALIHEKLYKSPNISRINFQEYVQSLTESLFHNYINYPGRVRLNLDIDKISLDLDTAIPCGLLLNELVTNSLKYAFPEDTGNITIKFNSTAPHQYELVVADDGQGLAEDFDLDSVDTLGLQIVLSLVKQIDGTLKLDRSSGTCYKIKFKEMKYQNRI